MEETAFIPWGPITDRASWAVRGTVLQFLTMGSVAS